MRSIHLWNVAREEFYLRGKPPASQPSPVCVKRVCRYHCPGESSSSKAPGEDTAHPDNGFSLLVLQKVPRGATGMGWSTWRTPHGYGLHLLPVLSGVKAIRARLPLLFPCACSTFVLPGGSSRAPATCRLLVPPHSPARLLLWQLLPAAETWLLAAPSAAPLPQAPSPSSSPGSEAMQLQGCFLTTRNFDLGRARGTLPACPASISCFLLRLLMRTRRV